MEEQQQIEQESADLVENLKGGVGTFSKLLAEEKPGRRDADALKRKLADEKTREEKV